jgi:exonuclease III
VLRALVEFISWKSIDIIAFTKTWFNEFDAAVKAESIPNGYKLLENSRLNHRGGGDALVFRNNISAKKIEVISRESFEVGEHVLTSNSWQVRLAVVYRPPSSCVNTFLNDFATYVESLIMCLEPILITGHFNFHVDNSMDLHASAFLDLLDYLNIEQYVHSVTQVTCHTLDLIITLKMHNIIECLPVSDFFLSDHSTVLCDLNVT